MPASDLDTHRSRGAYVLGMLVCVAALVAFLGFLLAQGRTSATPIDEVSAAVTAVTDLSTMKRGDNSMVKRLYGIDPNDYDGVVLYYPNSAANANELLVVRLASTSQQETVKAAVAKRLATETTTFNGYGVGQYEMLQASVTDVNGNYVLFVVSANPREADSAFRAAL